MIPLSVCCLTYNSERTIRRTLESVAGVADEIIVVDSGSTDSTLDIVKEFTPKVFHRPYDYHCRQMNHALDKCSNDWVFCIDSDESLNDRMIEAIKGLKENGTGGLEAFRIDREWHFMSRHVHAFYPSSSPDRIVRMFDRTVSRFNDRPVHDKPVGFKTEGLLDGRLIHDCSGSLHELYDKMNKYTTRHVKGLPSDLGRVTLLNVLFNPVFAFIKWYFIKKSFLDGFPGLVLGTYAAMYTFMKYAKLYSLKINGPCDTTGAGRG